MDEYEETLKGFSDFVYVRIEQAPEGGAPTLGDSFFFRAEDLTKVVSAAEAGTAVIGVIGTGSMGPPWSRAGCARPIRAWTFSSGTV